MSYNVLVVDDQTMPRQLFENIIKNSGLGFDTSIKKSFR